MATPRFSDSAGIADGQRLAHEQDLAAGGLVHPGDALDEGGLPGAVRAEQAVDLSLDDVEVHALERLDSRELLHELADLEDLRHATTSPRRF